MNKRDKCPICKSSKYAYNAYDEEYWGSIITVEQNGYCPQCGYIIKQAYSPVFEAFAILRKVISVLTEHTYRKILVNTKGIVGEAR